MTVAELLDAARSSLAEKRLQQSHQHCLDILAVEPNHPEAHYLLALNSLQRQLPAKAVQLLRVATGNEKRDARYWAQLARAQILVGSDQEAAKAAQCALDLNPADSFTLDTLGVLCTRLNWHEQALLCAKRSCELHPEQPEYHFNLATALRMHGQLQDAYAAFEHHLQLLPEDCRGCPAVAELCPDTEVKRWQQAFQTRLAHTELSAAQRLQLSHALARLQERQQQPVPAMQTLVQGKQAWRKQLNHHPDMDQAVFDRIRSRCDAEFLQSSHGVDSARPVFIMGMPRTGTSLLEQLLAQHPQVFGAGELSYFPGLCRQAAASRNGRRVAERLDADDFDAAADMHAGSLGEAYLQRINGLGNDAPRLIDKAPINILYAGLIHRALPRAQLICLRRHPLDVVVSNFRQLFALDYRPYDYAHSLQDCARYYLGFERLVDHWQSLLPDRVFKQVAYESVVGDTEAIVGDLLRWLALDGDPWQAQPLQSETVITSASTVQLREEIHGRSIGRWREVETVLAPVLELFSEAGLSV